MEQTQTRARALIRGTGAWAGVRGLATFRQCHRGVLVTLELEGLPAREEPEPWFGVGIQSAEGDTLSAGATPPGRPLPPGQSWPARPGELPPLTGCDGVAFGSFLPGRVRVQQIIGSTLTIRHRPPAPDLPAGETGGEPVAWGEIVAGC